VYARVWFSSEGSIRQAICLPAAVRCPSAVRNGRADVVERRSVGGSALKAAAPGRLVERDFTQLPVGVPNRFSVLRTVVVVSTSRR
jgi:hypothetical protein